MNVGKCRHIERLHPRVCQRCVLEKAMTSSVPKLKRMLRPHSLDGGAGNAASVALEAGTDTEGAASFSGVDETFFIAFKRDSIG